MIINISKEFMYKETKKALQSLFSLAELEEIQIKEAVVSTLEDEQAINRAIDECFHDIYSDVDIQIKIKLNQAEYNAKSPIYADCLRRLGFDNDILGMSHYCTEKRGEIIRICKTNGMRFDLIITAVYVDGAADLPHDDISDNLRKVDNFWFVAVQSLGKLMRKDYLISSHLAHMLIQEGLLLQMIMRDNDKGTNVHRFGYAEKLDYLTVYDNEDIYFSKTSDETYNYIARLLYSAVKSYDRLYSSLDSTYKSRIENYLAIWSCYCQSKIVKG